MIAAHRMTVPQNSAAATASAMVAMVIASNQASRSSVSIGDLHGSAGARGRVGVVHVNPLR